MSSTPPPDLPQERLEATLRPPAIKVRGLTKCYGSERVLDNIDLTVWQGEFMGLIGPNGSGKSTLLRILIGLEEIEEGEVEILGTPLSRFTEWGRVGYVPQHLHEFRSDFPATALDVVLMGRISRRGLLGRLRGSDRKKAMAALTEVGMTKLANRRIGELSGGERQRVFIAKALSHDPDLLILDEPTTGVDATSQDQFFALLKRLNEERRLTIILVSHDLPVVMSRASSVACLSRTIHYHGDPEGLLAGDVIETVFGQERGLVLGTHHHHHLHPSSEAPKGGLKGHDH